MVSPSSESSSVSPRKRRANRRNAKQSTGPRTEEGKARSAQNARTHGVFCRDVVLEGENHAEFNRIRRQFIQRLRPQDPLELSFVERVAEGTWRLMRLNRMEAQQHVPQQPDGQGDMTAAEGQLALMLMSDRISPSMLNRFAPTERTADEYGPARQRIELSINRGLRELRTLQKGHRLEDLPVSPYLDEEEQHPAPQTENSQNEPTDSAMTSSSGADTVCAEQSDETDTGQAPGGASIVEEVRTADPTEAPQDPQPTPVVKEVRRADPPRILEPSKVAQTSRMRVIFRNC
jgi:hypothetical protein